MRAIEITAAGGPETLRACERPTPDPRAGEVLIQVHAAGVNGHDLHHRQTGARPLSENDNDLPGLEVAGRIVAVGVGVDRAAIGSRVCALLRGGGYADHAVARHDLCLPVPDGLTMVEAASLPEGCFTVWSNIFADSRARAGERLLVNGGASGIGVTAIQIARQLGLDVIATARGPAKCALCLDLGATVALDHGDGEWVEAVLEETGGEGVDLVLEMIGGDYFAQDLAVLRAGGRLICIAAARGSEATIDFASVMRKRLTLTGSTLRPRPLAYKAEIAAQLRATVWPLYASGAVQPVIDSIFPLADAAAAHARMEARLHAGKVVLQVEDA